MGYRINLGRVKKTDREIYRNLKPEGDDLDDFSPYAPDFHKRLYEIGKYFHLDGYRENFYDFYLEECEFDIIPKEGLRKIIEMFEGFIVEGFNEVTTDVEKIKYFENFKEEWIRDSVWNLKPYYLDESIDRSDGMVSKSYKYEYAIFNLVHIYRTFDWNNDYLIYSGY